MSEMHCKHTLLGCLLVGTVVKASLNMQVPDKCENVSAIVIATLNDATDVLLYLRLYYTRESYYSTPGLSMYKGKGLN